MFICDSLCKDMGRLITICKLYVSICFHIVSLIRVKKMKWLRINFENVCTKTDENSKFVQTLAPTNRV